MAKLTDLEKQQIIADYIETQNYSEVAKKYNRSVETIRNVVKDNEDVRKKLKQKKQENTQSTIEYMQTQHESKKRILDKILKAIEEKADNIDKFTNIKDLATAYGIILDKELKVLELNKKNDNNEDLEKVKDIMVSIRRIAEDDKKDWDKFQTSRIYKKC